MTTDEELLRHFAEHRDENAFREIVERHAGLVLGVAKRRLQDMESARDVAQQVFTLLAWRAPRLHRAGKLRLAGWLHRTALLMAGNVARSERRRSHYHQSFACEMNNDDAAIPQDEAPWRDALPLIDAAIDSLSAADRDVVLGHYYQRRTFCELAATAGKSDHAMQKRAARALEKLSGFFRRRGIGISTAALAAGLVARPAEAVPAGFAAATATAAIKSAPGLNAASVFANTLATMTITKLTTAAAAVAFLLPLGWQWQQNSRAAATPARASGINRTRATAPRPAAVRPADETRVASALPDKSPLGILAAEIAKLEATNDPVQFLRVKRLILALPPDELPSAFDLVKSVREADALDLSRAVFGRWGEVAPEAGLTVARLPSTMAWREAMLAASGGPALTTLGLFETWVLRDPAAAFAAAQEWDATQVLRDEFHRQEIPDMLASLAIRDPARALKLAATLTEESVREPATGMIQQAWALQDPEAALRWISENSPDETRPRDLAWLLRCITASQPDRALTLALTLENPHVRAGALDFALHNWAVDQPRAALEAMLGLPDEELTPYLVRHAAVFLAGEDLAVMAQATERVPEGERREVFAELVVRSWPSHDRAACLEWLSGVEISESARRKIQNETTQP